MLSLLWTLRTLNTNTRIMTASIKKKITTGTAMITPSDVELSCCCLGATTVAFMIGCSVVVLEVVPGADVVGLCVVLVVLVVGLGVVVVEVVVVVVVEVVVLAFVVGLNVVVVVELFVVVGAGVVVVVVVVVVLIVVVDVVVVGIIGPKIQFKFQK